MLLAGTADRILGQDGDFDLEEDILGIGGIIEVEQFSDLTIIDTNDGGVWSKPVGKIL